RRADPGRGGGVGAVLRRDGAGRRFAQRLRPERAPWTFADRQIRKAPATRSSRAFSGARKIKAMSGYGALRADIDMTRAIVEVASPCATTSSSARTATQA